MSSLTQLDFKLAHNGSSNGSLQVVQLYTHTCVRTYTGIQTYIHRDICKLYVKKRIPAPPSSPPPPPQASARNKRLLSSCIFSSCCGTFPFFLLLLLLHPPPPSFRPCRRHTAYEPNKLSDPKLGRRIIFRAVFNQEC